MSNAVLDGMHGTWSTVVTTIDEIGLVFVRGRDERTLLQAAVADSVGTSHAPLRVGDVVIACPLAGTTPSVAIIGRLAQAHDPNDGRASSSDDIPDSLLLEAKECLTLRVGTGSITIRADGKILIKGKELVSHAQNVNRVKGGAVAIN